MYEKLRRYAESSFKIPTFLSVYLLNSYLLLVLGNYAD
jgi:hypothetical protein